MLRRRRHRKWQHTTSLTAAGAPERCFTTALLLLYFFATVLLLYYCLAYEVGFGRINTTSALLSLLQKLGASYAGSAGGNPQPFTFSCQHGWGECMGNALEACIQDVQPDYTKFLPVFDCIESRSCAGHLLSSTSTSTKGKYKYLLY